MLATQIGSIQLDSCIYNASGPRCTKAEELHEIGKSSSSAILTKSCTIAHREGNPAPRYFENLWGSINSMGLPNNGLEYYLALSKEMEEYDKPYMLSMAGLSLDENLKMLEMVNSYKGVSAIELNLSCPNVPDKPQTAYDFERTKDVLDRVFEINSLPLGVKLPPYFDLIHFQEMADILNQYPLDFVTCINSIGNALIIDIELEQVVIKPKGGFGGLGGDYAKPTALANVHKFRQLLKSEISVIGCGGIKTGTDIFEHLLCGADAVQIGTHYMRVGSTCFEQLETELEALMLKKGYSNINDFKGTLKTI